jgi:hypothetical protein
MNRYTMYILLLLLAIAQACNNTPAPEEDKRTPEEIIRLFQSHYDKNDFETAKQLSTPKVQEFLSMLAKQVAADPIDSTLFNTTFINISCEQKVDTAFCKCLLKDDYEDEYETEYKLVKVGGRWLVDASEEDFSTEEMEIFLPEDSLETDLMLKEEIEK